jgi:hypothetical protein
MTRMSTTAPGPVAPVVAPPDGGTFAPGPTYAFETDAGSGIPRLRPCEGPRGDESPAELQELERLLGARYEQLRREPRSVLRVASRDYLVENRDPNGSRQPRLLIRPAAPPAASSRPEAPASDPAPRNPSDWADGFFAEVRSLSGRPEQPLFEARAIEASAEELQALGRADPTLLAAVVLAGYLALVDQACRGQDPDRAAVYALALRGLDRILPESPAGGPGWRRGDFSALGPGSEAGGLRIGRLLARLVGLPARPPARP